MKQLKVKEKLIMGVNNPFLSVVVSKKDPEANPDIIVLEDGESIDFQCRVISRRRTVLTAELSQNSKKIELFEKDKDTIHKLCELKNIKIIRALNKIKKIYFSINRKIKKIIYTLYKGIRFFWREYHFLVPVSLWKKYLKDFRDRIKETTINLYNPMDINDYNKWLKNNKKPTNYEEFAYNPLISILIPVYNIGRTYLSECLDSILNQSYNNFEICLVDDCSTKEETKETLKEYEQKDKRIRVKYRKENGHISKTTNDALEMAKGEFVGLMDDDDVLDKDALYEVVKVLNTDKTLDFIYSDEDKLNTKGKRCYPHFKPDFSPDTLLSLNYICHFTVIRKKLVKLVGGFEVGLEGAQDYDLFLKCTENTNKIYHISKILYHWRMIEGSTSMALNNKSYASDKGLIALKNALARRKIDGNVEKDEQSGYYIIKYNNKKEPKVSIIIPTRDYLDILKPCVDSIYQKTTYKNFEIIIANNQSVKKETLSFFKEYKKKYKNFKVIACDIEFNYSKINNMAISKCDGEYIVLLNNDTEIITPEWLDIMVGYASQEHVGAVGVKLLYEDQTIQHAGVVLGLGGVASHVYIGKRNKELGIYGRLNVPYDYSANTAACLMISRKKYDEVGGLEEELKVAYNDIDLNLKLRKKYYNVFLPQVELIHYESKSRGLDTTSEKYKRFLIESKYMYDKWESIIENDRFYNKNFSKNGWFMLDKK